MKTLLAALAALLVASPAVAQVPVTTCTIVRTVVSCTVVPGTTLTAADAVRLLTDHATVIVPWGREAYPYSGAPVLAAKNSFQQALPPTYPLQRPFFQSTYVGPTIGVVSLGPDGYTPR